MIFRYTTCLILVFVWAMNGLQAQVFEVQNGFPITPENLITNTFLGDGIEVINVSYEGAANSVALFKNGNDALGLNRGIVMTTGNAVPEAGVGISNDGDDQSSGSISMADNDPDLTAIAGNASTNNIVKYVITFRPSSDNLQFRYVFGSEEYPEYVCSNFNDIFGFFISGPGITGPFENNAKNIALVPGTNLPVRINNINPGEVGSAGNPDNCTPPNGSLDYSEFYVDNDGSSNPPVFDGLTTVLIAEAEVIPCEVYTIKLVICDVGDSAFDSGVFLEAKSFGAPALTVDPVGLSIDGTLSEGCGSGTLDFHLPRRAESDYPIDFAIYGTATNGDDYTLIPDTLWIPQGDSLIQLPFDIFEDNVPEGDETFIISYQRDICTRDTLQVTLRDKLLYQPDIPDLLVICEGDETSVDATLDIPLPDPPAFTSTAPLDIPASFDNTPFYSDIEVSGVIPSEFGPGILKSVCIDSVEHRWIDDLDFYLISPDGRFLELSTDNGGDGGNLTGLDYIDDMCFSPNATEFLTEPGTQADASGLPFTGEWLPEGIFSDLWDADNLRVNGTWQLLVIDDQFGLGGTVFSWTICFEPYYKIDYAWSPAEGLSCTDCPNPTMQPDSTTTYYLTITDSYNCEVQDSVTVEVLEAPPVPDLSCYVVTNGSVSVIWEESPLAEGYEISVDGGPFTDPSDGNIHYVDGMAEGQAVTFIVQTLGDCPQSDTLVCTSLNCLPPDVLIDNTPTTCPGVANGVIDVSATGSGPFTYQLADESNTSGVFNDLAPGAYLLTVVGTNSCPYTEEIIVESDEELMGAIGVVSPISCNGESDAVLEVVMENGDAPYTYTWSNSESTIQTDDWGPGMVSVFVVDANGCENTYTIELQDPTELTVQIAINTEIACGGIDSGVLEALPQGGVSPYTFAWNNGPATGSNDQLGPGNYDVLVTDANGCTATAVATLTAPALLSASVTTTPRSCAEQPDGSATVTAQGGTAPYTYTWDDADGQSTETAVSLEDIMYTVTVTDANGCTTVAQGTVASPPQVTASFTSGDVSCFEGEDGQATVTATGGDGNYSYTWSDASLPAQAVQTTLTAGTYTVTVTDGNSCTDVLEIVIDEPTQITSTAAITNVNCEGEASGEIDLSVSGGTPPYTYNWSNGTATEDVQNLMATLHSVTVTDANGCRMTFDYSVAQNTVLAAALEPIDVACFGETTGSIFSTVSGGEPPYTFAWSNGATTADLDNVGAGEYTLTITDALDCAFSLTTTIAQPTAALRADVIAEDISCFGLNDGLVSVQPMGGTPPYEFSMNNAPFSANGSFLGLGAGSYTVQVVDANNCAFDAGQVDLTQPDEIVVELGDRLDMFFGQTDVQLFPTITSSRPIVSYAWSPADSSWISCADCPTPFIYPDNQLSLRLTVMDEFGCTGEDILLVRVLKNFPVEVPTGFTPNGDQVNDKLRVHGMDGIRVVHFRIFDRWGEMLHEESDFMVNSEVGWDGMFRSQPMNGGLYIWHVEAEMPDGRRETFMGETTLIR